MALDNQPFDEVTESDLRELISNAVPEGLLIEYKQSNYGGADADKKEFLKDVSAFANASGGHLIIGLSESAGVPTALVPFAGDPDVEVRRMESLALSSIQPRVIGLRFRAISAAAGGHYFLIRIPKSWNAPHRVTFGGINRFYARRSASSPELSLEELRVAFTSSATAVERAQAFHTERVARIDSGSPIAPIVTGSGILVVHLVPLEAFASSQTIDVDRARTLSQQFAPVSASGMRPRLNLEGFINMDVPGAAYTQVFRNGIVESVSTYIIGRFRGSLWVDGAAIEQNVIEALPRYVGGLNSLGSSLPMLVAISLLGVAGGLVNISGSHLTFDNPDPIQHHQVDLPSALLEALPATGAEWRRLLRPAFDALANASGRSRAHLFDSDGNWIPPRPVGA